MATQENCFDEAYRLGLGSGSGSAVHATTTYRHTVESFLRLNNVRTVIDLGCGDWQFSPLIPWAHYGISYLGLDISSVIVEANQAAFGSTHCNFKVIERPDELKTFAAVDLIICKDALQHMPNNMINAYLDGFEAVGDQSLVTNDIVPAHGLNQDIELGGYRSIDIRQPPFSRRSSVIAEYAVFDGQTNFLKHVHLMPGRRSA
jgi:SAM-dependent methyltransferase